MSQVDRFPRKLDYQNALLHPERCLKDPRLRSARVETRALFSGVHLPFPRAGNFGGVYKLSTVSRNCVYKSCP